MTLHGHPLAREMETWYADHHGVAGDPEWELFLEHFSTLWAEKRLELSQEHSNAGRFGMSKAGGCTRSVALKILGREAEPFSGSTRHTFFIGHLVEIEAVATLRAMGYDVTGQQEPVTIDPFMHSFSDGIILGRPDKAFTAEKAILSVKSAGYKMSGKVRKKFLRRGFTELPFEGVRRSQPGHWAQLQAEMHGSGIRMGLYVVASKDIIKAFEGDEYMGEKGNGSLAFYTEIVPYAQKFCESVLVPLWQEQWDAVQAGNPGPARYLSKTQLYEDLSIANLEWLPNADRTGTFNPCGYCDMLKACAAAIANI